MSFQPLSNAAAKRFDKELTLRRQAEAADSAVAIAKAKLKMASYIIQRIDAGENASNGALVRALESRLQAMRTLRRAQGARHLLLSRLVRVRRGIN